jgi:hypothetical protein
LDCAVAVLRVDLLRSPLSLGLLLPAVFGWVCASERMLDTASVKIEVAGARMEKAGLINAPKPSILQRYASIEWSPRVLRASFQSDRVRRWARHVPCRRCAHSEIPPFGVPELVCLIFTIISTVTLVLKTHGIGRVSTSAFAEDGPMICAFFIAFGIRQLFLRSVLIALIVVSSICAIVSDSAQQAAGLERRVNWYLVGVLALVGLAVGLLTRGALLFGSHMCLSKGMSYRVFCEERDHVREARLNQRGSTENVSTLLPTQSNENGKSKILVADHPAALPDARHQVALSRLQTTRRWKHDAVGILNAPGVHCSLWQSVGAFDVFPELRCWETLTLCMLVGTAVGVSLESQSPSDDEEASIVSFLSMFCSLLSLSRFDSRYLFWTLMVGLLIFGNLVAVLTLSYVPHETGSRLVKNKTVTTLLPYSADEDVMRLVLNQIVSACLFILWTARLLRAAFYIPSTRRAEIALHATQVANLQGRGFQTGDVLLCGTPASCVSCIAEFETMSEWGHVAMICREPSIRVRTAFALGHWLIRLPRLTRPLLFPLRQKMRHAIEKHLARSENVGLEHCANIYAKTAVQAVRLFGGGGIAGVQELEKLAKASPDTHRVMELLDSAFHAGDKSISAGMDPALLHALFEHEKRFPLKIPTSPSGLYVIEAVGSGTRMTTIESFFDFWCRRRREKVAWRPLISTTFPSIELALHLDDVSDLVAKVYPPLCKILSNAMETSTLCSTKQPGCCCCYQEKRKRSQPYFCSSFVAVALREMDVLGPGWDKAVDRAHVVPSDFADDSRANAIIGHFKDNWWELGELLALSL